MKDGSVPYKVGFSKIVKELIQMNSVKAQFKNFFSKT
jgi:hypothetical protein